MNRKSAFWAAVTALVLAVMIGAPLACGQSQDVLRSGTYAAKVKAIVCDGCGPLIQKTLQGMKEIEAVKVDQDKKTVQFTVKKDATVKVSDLQKALKAAADRMGMGADYTLSDLHPTK
jgi:hypothetical protein